jgi:hypothetical protein
MALNFKNRWIWAGLCTFAVMMVSAGCGPDLYLMHKVEESVDGGDWINRGGGCMLVDESSTSSTGAGTVPGNEKTPCEITLEVKDGVGEFTVTVDGKRVEHRTFDKDFLESSEIEKVTFAVSDTEEQRYSFWGGSECEPPETPDE